MDFDENDIEVELFGRVYPIRCLPGKRDDTELAVKQAADYLRGQMLAVRNRHRQATFDKIVVVAALNLVHEMLTKKRQTDDQEARIEQKLVSLKKKIEAV